MGAARDPPTPSGGGRRAPDRSLAVTHEVTNQPIELADYNLYAADRALREAVAREGAGAFESDLVEFGRRVGTAEYLELGQLANRYPPEVEPNDRLGHRTDPVPFHPPYHALMRTAITEGPHAPPPTRPGPGAHAPPAAR